MQNKVVILRMSEDADEIAQAVRDHGLVPLIEPVLSVEYLSADLPETDLERPLIFTSANGVRAFAKLSAERSHPVYTVGRNTADEARQMGFTRVESAFGTVTDMVDLLAGALKTGLKCPIYVRGEEVSQDLSQILGDLGVNIDEIMAYRTIPAENLSINLLKSLSAREIKAVMAFSAKGARVFTDLARQYGREGQFKIIKALCIGEGVVQSVSVLPFQEVVVAYTPDRYGMIKLLDQLT